MSTALIPVKSLAQSKSRLATEFAQPELEALSLAMLEDLLSALLATPALKRIAVATPDDRAAELVRRLGGEALHGPDPGLKAAIDGAASKLHLGDHDALLVVLGDLPDARPEDLQELFDKLDELDGPAAALAPSSDGGTSALLRRPHTAIPSCFGPESAARHREAAAAAGVPLCEIALPSLDLDLDSIEDIEQFLAHEGSGAHTRAALAEIGWPK
ncbi:MAG: 2-phospho-L-lactate guanylyltransferase [Myxococcota bacterium]